MTDTSVGRPSSSDRFERVLAVHLRQELEAPVIAMMGFLDIMIEDARRFAFDDSLIDLDNMRGAAAELSTLIRRIIEAPESIRDDAEDEQSFQGRLRHDLRTPLNAIKGYCELLLEDLDGKALEELSPDLQKVQDSAQDLIALIDAIVDRTHRSAGVKRAAPMLPAEIVTSVLGTIAPLGMESDQPKRDVVSRILIVDDIASNRDLLSRQLARQGHKIVAVESGTQALDCLVSDEFDLILLDLIMPEMSGFDVLRRVKSNSKTRHIPVIIISALDEFDSAVRCIEAGAEDYLVRPFNPVLLRARIGACLEKKWLRDREQRHFEELRFEKQRSESLLLNILPQTIVTRMRNGEAMIADRFDDATILFADMVGFTLLSTDMTPSQVLETLSALFSRFDIAVARHGLEKIKTIGDAYMVAGGLPEPGNDHTNRIADLALDMLDIVRETRASLDIDLTIRIGIHTGAVVAGVLGTHKFIYDVWGDTVNTASRMETFGAPSRIHVSTATREVLGDAYEFEPREPLDIRGKGVMETFFLLGARRTH